MYQNIITMDSLDTTIFTLMLYKDYATNGDRFCYLDDDGKLHITGGVVTTVNIGDGYNVTKREGLHNIISPGSFIEKDESSTEKDVTTFVPDIAHIGFMKNILYCILSDGTLYSIDHGLILDKVINFVDGYTPVVIRDDGTAYGPMMRKLCLVRPSILYMNIGSGYEARLYNDGLFHISWFGQYYSRNGIIGIYEGGEIIRTDHNILYEVIDVNGDIYMIQGVPPTLEHLCIPAIYEKKIGSIHG